MNDDIKPKSLDIVPLESKTAQELLECPLDRARWIVEGLIAVGLVILAGAPKIGKSWFVLLLALCVSLGEPFLSHATQQAGVLYLCLEDTYSRIQQRLFRLTDSANDDLHLVVASRKLKDGLIEQLKAFIGSHSAIRLVIIDTLQVVREVCRDGVYAVDYNDLGSLKRFADENDIAVLLVHHTRKMPDESNVFNMVSGSNGIVGSADETLVLSKSNAFDSRATLSVTGRDVELAEYKLVFKDCHWILIEQTSREELEERQIPDSVLKIIGFMAERISDWSGTATQLIDEVGIPDMQGNILTKYLNEHSDFLEERGIEYRNHRTAQARLISLSKIARLEDSCSLADDGDE